MEKAKALKDRIAVLENELGREKEARRQIQDKLQRFTSLIDNLPGLAFICRNDSEMTIEFANRNTLDMLGYEPDQLRSGLAFRKLIPHEDQVSNKQILSRLSRNNRKYQLIYRIRTSLGTVKWVKEEGTAIYPAQGEFEIIVGLLTDITDHKRMEMRLLEENIRLKSSIKDRYRLGNLIGKSAAMQRVYDIILKSASSDASVIITGESGTGKELAANAIHDMSERQGKPFIAVNCGAIPDNLLESEFFGYRKGAFSGAYADRAGFLDAADTGTLFLDEVGEVSLPMQAKLLRALDGNGYTPMGENFVRFSDFRLIAATNRNLRDLVREGLLREDFYYRINTIPLHMPPLRERKEDIPLLIDHILESYSAKGKKSDVPPDVRMQLIEYSWPGNVRELHNVLSRYLTLTEIDFSTSLPGVRETGRDGQGVADRLSENVNDFEKQLITVTLEKNKWHVGLSAAELGLSRRTLQRRIQKYRLK